jgi:hypothetical protein
MADPRDPIEAAADAHRLTLRLGNWCCSCGWYAGTADGREAMAEHAAHVHVVAGLADATLVEAMADPRDTARQWLAFHICASAVEEGGRALGPPCGSCIRRADAILSAAGVTVASPKYPIGELCPTCDGSIGPHSHTQVVIRLPAEEGRGEPDA